MKNLKPEWVVLYLLIGLIFYEMTLLAAAVFFKDVELAHVRDELRGDEDGRRGSDHTKTDRELDL